MFIPSMSIQNTRGSVFGVTMKFKKWTKTDITSSYETNEIKKVKQHFKDNFFIFIDQNQR